MEEFAKLITQARIGVDEMLAGSLLCVFR